MITREIASLQHPIVKHLVKLREERSYRKKQQTVLVSGTKLIKEIASFKTIVLEQGVPLPHGVEAKQLFIVPPEILKKITALENPEPIAGEAFLPPAADLNGKKYLIALDGINDPGNLGTLLRTALALGWEGAFITVDSADPFNDKAVRAAKGATFRLPLMIGSQKELEHLIEKNNFHAYVADAEGAPFTDVSFRKPVLLILGNEAHGVSPLIKKKQPTLSIPMHPEMESLNVASAGAILMYTIKGQADGSR